MCSGSILESRTNSIQPDLNFVNIGNDAGNLNGFQRRLIHQMVRNEFPTLRTFARNDGSFMQIERLDVKKEEEVWFNLLVQA